MAFGRLSLQGRALKYLAAREYSRAELAGKLKPFEEEPGQIQQVLQFLEGRGFLSEERTADSIVNRRRDRLGAARIRHEMVSKGLPAELISTRIEALQATELVRAREVRQRQFGTKAPSLPERARQQRFLSARGFSSEVVRRVLREPGSDASD